MADLVLEGIGAVTDMLIQEVEILKKRSENRKRRVWTRNWILRREALGASTNFLREVAVEDEETFKNHLRLTTVQFDELLGLVKPKIQKLDTNMSAALPARLKLQITLRYLASGCCFRTLESLYRVPISSISKFLPLVLDSIYEALENYIRVPKSAAEWSSVARGFEEHWNFPGCCGALDGKHVNIQQPHDSGSDFYNYKGFFSTVLLALVDSNYSFIFIDVGTQGRMNDSTIFNNSTLKEMIEDRSLNFPNWGVILGDEGFALKQYLIKPFSRKMPLKEEEKLFDYRLSRARRIVENAFGIMAMRFRIYRTPIYLNPEKVDKIVKATCVLHNWLMKTSRPYYAPPGIIDTEDANGQVRPGSWRMEATSTNLSSITKQQGSNNYSLLADRRRQKYMSYFLADGAVPWQNMIIH